MIRVVLVHPGEFVLPELGEQLGRYASRKLAKRGVEIRSNAKIKAVTSTEVELTNGTRSRSGNASHRVLGDVQRLSGQTPPAGSRCLYAAGDGRDGDVTDLRGLEYFAQQPLGDVAPRTNGFAGVSGDELV